ncbi:sensor histidine kinase [Laspinema olomoucense]|uniref:histidine kinase n=1 Tax=Laspinema olomoucense D3b TaxID=2953688 RepID=A0ABT2N3T5_9CYAN|nr:MULTISPECIES: PAS domain-containing sensor histidine kinase [unclassified Laspinema]MCT7977347.1 PAS domain-containing sensor histidine kinase [Laspinema sp. D3b]MCT7997148.1 PAS domain-containing sensor histidine kinase [Laspinema sp. D3c]
MAIVAFFLGLAVGIGFWLCQQFWMRQQLQQWLGGQTVDSFGSYMPIMSRLRRVIAWMKQERQQLEAQLEEGRQLLQVAPVGYLQVDEENQLVWCNSQAQEILQIHKWEPSSPRLLLKFVRSYELDHLIEQTRQEQKAQVREWVFHPACQNGSEMGKTRSLTLRGYSWPLGEGQVGVFLENRQPLVTLAQNRDRWMNDLAHELKTPLTSISLVAEALQGRLEPPWSQRVERLSGETNRLIKLVQDWLELTHLEVDPGNKLVLKSVDICALIQSVWQTLEPLARQKQLNFEYSGPEQVFLEADESKLYRVFLNILDNSIRYSSPQGKIQAIIATEIVGDRSPHPQPTLEHEIIQIDMIDSGAGFSLSDLPYIFDRLYRGDPARARQSLDPTQSSGKAYATSPGSGLGLAIAQQIITAHGGTIKASNHPQTGGAWLQLRLPCDRALLNPNL